MKIKTRKMLFLSTIISRGTQPRKDDNDGIEVGPGFADAVARVNSDDTRTPTPAPAPAATEEPDDDQGGEGDDDQDDQGGDDGDEGTDEAPENKRKTSKYIREIKAEKAELARKLGIVETLLYKKETEGSTNKNETDNPPPQKVSAPDPNDAEKYPLGVLDDRYQEDKIEWTAEQKVRQILDGERQTERAREARDAEAARQAGLNEKVSVLTAKGLDLFDDFDTKVLEKGMKGEWDLTETTFEAASELPHGERILYDLASDKAEASRVAKLSKSQQTIYVKEKSDEYQGKIKPRTKPAAEDVPGNMPRGRNSTAPIRADTDNLNDFRKIWYATKK